MPSALNIIFKNIITCDMLNLYGTQGLKYPINHNKTEDHKTSQIMHKHGPDQSADELLLSMLNKMSHHTK